MPTLSALATEKIHHMSPFISSSKIGKLTYGAPSQDSGCPGSGNSGCPETGKVGKEGGQKGNSGGKVW